VFVFKVCDGDCVTDVAAPRGGVVPPLLLTYLPFSRIINRCAVRALVVRSLI
jgi:hypothetical protein